MFRVLARLAAIAIKNDPKGRNGQALALATQTDVPMSDVGSDVEMDDPNESSSVADAPAGLGTGFMD